MVTHYLYYQLQLFEVFTVQPTTHFKCDYAFKKDALLITLHLYSEALQQCFE